MGHDFVVPLYFSAGSSWELVLYQRHPPTTNGGDGADPTEVNIEIPETVVQSFLSVDIQQEKLSESDMVGVKIEVKGSQRQIKSVLFNTDDQLENNHNPYLEPESLTLYDELGGSNCVMRYANIGPNSIVEFGPNTIAAFGSNTFAEFEPNT